MSSRPRRPIMLLAAFALALVVVAPTAPEASANDTAALSIGSAELELVRLMNESRASAGLPAVTVDARVASVARARSVDMATKNYFSHTQPDGRKVFDLLTAAGIPWASAGEILAWNTWSNLADSALSARNAWLESSSHRPVLLGTGYNAVGVGAAISSSTGRVYWTAVFVVLRSAPVATTPAPAPVAAPAPSSGVDRTGPWVRWAPSGIRGGGYRRQLTIRWYGADTTAAVVSGLRDFQIQMRRNGGRWVWVNSSTTLGRRHVYVIRGSRYEFRVRARDRAGLSGPWIYQTVRT